MHRTVVGRWSFVAVVAVVLAVPALAHQAPAAQEPAAPAAQAPAAPAAPAGGFQGDVAADLERTGQKLVALAEAIPADKYGWRPGEGVRSVSEVLVHVANGNTLMPPALGASPPAGVALPQDMPSAMAWMREQEATTTAKDDVVRALRQSVEYAAASVRGMASPALEDTVDVFGFPASRRAYVLILLTHNHEHLGQAIAYARSVGVTPPWSEAQPEPEAAEPAAAEPY